MTQRDDQPANATSQPTGTHEVGYKKPPKRTQFAKGHSGNPNGRPKRPEGVSIKELLDSEQHGKNGEVISKREALMIRLMNDAMAGKPKAFSWFLKCMAFAGLMRAHQPAHQGIIYLERGPSPSPHTYEAWKRLNGKA